MWQISLLPSPKQRINCNTSICPSLNVNNFYQQDLKLLAYTYGADPLSAKTTDLLKLITNSKTNPQYIKYQGS